MVKTNTVYTITAGILVGYLLGRRQLRRLVKTAHQDELTGLPDRSVMESTLKNALHHHESITVAMLDIDGLKLVNDKWGHQAGDETIMVVSNQLLSLLPALPHSGFVARIGGDEFVVITTATPKELKTAYLDTFDGFSSKAAVGVSELHPHEHIDHVLACADVAMYYAKQRREPVVLYDPLTMTDPEVQRPTHVRQRAR